MHKISDVIDVLSNWHMYIVNESDGDSNIVLVLPKVIFDVNYTEGGTQTPCPTVSIRPSSIQLVNAPPPVTIVGLIQALDDKLPQLIQNVVGEHNTLPPNIFILAST